MTTASDQVIDWYFDFISPFAYLQHMALLKAQAERPDLTIHYHPILFAGLLKATAHKGPAEIPAKRTMTYRYCHWYAARQQIPFRIPAAHPFNPLALLRLSIAEGLTREIVTRLFQHVWVDSANNPDFFSVQALSQLQQDPELPQRIGAQTVKDCLKTNTERAISLGVFGVPTMVINGALFWGADMTAMALDYLDHPGLFDQEEFRRIENLPVAQARK